MIKGLVELLKKYRETADMTEEQFEGELNKLLPESWKPASVYNELNEKHKLLETQKAEVDKLLKEATENNKSADKLKDDYNKLLETQKAEKEKYEAELKATKKAFEIDLALTKAGSKNNKAVRALLDDEKITLSDKGELVGLSEQLESIKKDNDYLFIATEPNPTPNNPPKPLFGNGTNTPPNNGGDESLRKAFGL